MPNLNAEEIKKLKKRELIGLIALIGCIVASVCFIVLFIIATVRGDNNLKIATLIWYPFAIAILSLIAAIYNLKFGKALERITKNYIQDVFVENATLMRPERDSLTYYISGDGERFYVKVNNFKEEIIFDFSAFGKISAVKRANIYSAIIDRLGATFCRLYERGGKYKTVTYAVKKAKSRANLSRLSKTVHPTSAFTKTIGNRNETRNHYN